MSRNFPAESTHRRGICWEAMLKVRARGVGKKLGLTDLMKDILMHLITRKDTDRYSAKMFQQLPYLNSMLVRILKFMERESFSTRSRSEQVQFLRGMYKMLPQFSMALLRRKLLPNVSTTKTHSSCWKPPRTRHCCPTFFRMSFSSQSTSVRCDAWLTQHNLSLHPASFRD